MEQELSRSIRMFQLMDRMRRAWMEFTPESQLNKSQLGTLMALRRGTMPPCPSAAKPSDQMAKKLTLSALAARMGQSMPAVSQRISKLEAMGYVRRENDPKDRRTTWICLTPSGEKLLERAFQSMMQQLERIMDQLGEEDTAQMFRVLERLAQVMESTEASHRKETTKQTGEIG